MGGIDPDSLSRALAREVSVDRRDSAPAASPIGKKRRIDGDRFVNPFYLHFLSGSFDLKPIFFDARGCSHRLT